MDDAGAYLVTLAADGESEFRMFLQARRGSLYRPPRQPVWRCLEHLLLFISHTIEQVGQL